MFIEHSNHHLSQRKKICLNTENKLPIQYLMMHIIKKFTASIFIKICWFGCIKRINYMKMPMVWINTNIFSKESQFLFTIGYWHRASEWNFNRNLWITKIQSIQSTNSQITFQIPCHSLCFYWHLVDYVSLRCMHEVFLVHWPEFSF